MEKRCDRRDFLKLSSTVGAGLALGAVALSGCNDIQRSLGGTPADINIDPINRVCVGFIGVGQRGKGLCEILMDMDGVDVRAVCDLEQDRVDALRKYAVKKGYTDPACYSNGEQDYKNLCDRDDIDLVIVATPWNWHVPMNLYAMKAGKHVATEVPAAVTLDDCWKLVEVSEKTQKQCIMMENCCYFRRALMALNMVRKGLLGEIIHTQAGYEHYRIWDFFDAKGDLRWPAKHALERDGNQYPTHGLGPVAQCMNINRGDRFDYITSMSTKSVGINNYVAGKFGPDHPSAKLNYQLGDINTSMIHTANDKSIVLYYDTQLPRPYSLIWRVQGTNGAYYAYPEPGFVYVEGRTEMEKGWDHADDYVAEYEHPLWNDLKEIAVNSGHGGSDYVMLYRIINAFHKGQAPDSDVYDAATWSAVQELSARSVAAKSEPIEFPDFTRGKWKTNKPLEIVRA